MTALILDADEREELRLAAISRFIECQTSEEVFRLELARCGGMTATEIDAAVNDNRAARRKGTP